MTGTKHSVLMAQANYRYGRNVFIPYSIGSLQAYAQTRPEIQEGFQFQEPLFLRTDPSEVVRNAGNPAIACLSCYIWNWEYNKALARAIRASFPRCLIIFGGTQVPDASEGFFARHPYVDLLVHQEGELTFAEILRQFLSAHPDYTQVSGLSVRVEGNKTLKTKPAGRIMDLSQLPSPYLSGIFDFILGRGFTLNVSQETNRGCPYGCAFCDWGGNTHNKLYTIDEARILAEFEWFGKHQVGYLFNCDANFGILPRDHGLLRKMLAIRTEHGGFPEKFRMCTAKNSDNGIFDIAMTLNEAGMSKGATLSFQSMDPKTLRAVGRSNIRLEMFSALMARYRQADMPTYTELIMGMPGETYETTKRGVDEIIDGQDDVVNIHAYVCGMLPNSRMSQPDYVKQHGIKAVRMPILLAHSTPEPGSLPEYQDVVVETATMPQADWQRAYEFYWAVQTFHCLGLLQHIAIVCRRLGGINYSDFYERLIEYFAGREETLIGGQIALIRRLVRSSLTGGRLDLVSPRFGDIYWPLEEVSFLTLISEKGRCSQEIRPFVAQMLRGRAEVADAGFQDDLILYGSSIVKGPHDSEATITLAHDLHEYFGQPESWETFPARVCSSVHVKPERCFGGNLVEYAREIVWYGRKGGKFHHSDVTSRLL
ncbi:MAG: radical SAM protein [Patescibacteria group bacterium]|nr:radical SAM protein [Patescibacteria group bacterium]